MASRLYNHGLFELLTNAGTQFDDAAANIDVMLVTSAQAFDPDHNFVSDIVANELSVVGYARQDLANRSYSEDDVNDRVIADADDVSFGALSSGETIGAVVVFVNTGSDATSELIYYGDVPDTPTNGSTITIQWNATLGLWTVTSP